MRQKFVTWALDFNDTHPVAAGVIIALSTLVLMISGNALIVPT